MISTLIWGGESQCQQGMFLSDPISLLSGYVGAFFENVIVSYCFLNICQGMLAWRLVVGHCAWLCWNGCAKRRPGRSTPWSCWFSFRLGKRIFETKRPTNLAAFQVKPLCSKSPRVCRTCGPHPPWFTILSICSLSIKEARPWHIGSCAYQAQPPPLWSWSLWSSSYQSEMCWKNFMKPNMPKKTRQTGWRSLTARFWWSPVGWSWHWLCHVAAFWVPRPTTALAFVSSHAATVVVAVCISLRCSWSFCWWQVSAWWRAIVAQQGHVRALWKHANTTRVACQDFLELQPCFSYFCIFVFKTLRMNGRKMTLSLQRRWLVWLAHLWGLPGLYGELFPNGLCRFGSGSGPHLHCNLLPMCFGSLGKRALWCFGLWRSLHWLGWWWGVSAESVATSARVILYIFSRPLRSWRLGMTEKNGKACYLYVFDSEKVFSKFSI